MNFLSLKQQLAEFVANQWVDLRARLGGQLSEFVDVVARNAVAHQLSNDVSVARFLNLCCAFGPNFERKPENEWALALLADERLDERVKLHQLVVKGAAELKRRVRDAGSVSGQLLRGDSNVMDLLEASNHEVDDEFVGLARAACDLEAVDIRLLEVDWRREYRLVDGTWQRLPIPDLNVSLRIVAQHQIPALICVLTMAPKFAFAARLQVRLLTHAVCDQDHHPRVTHVTVDGSSRWNGHKARAVSWLVQARTAPAATNSLGVTLIEETMPQMSLLRINTCGLRDQGVPIGPVENYVWAYLADQWLFALQRDPCPVQQWPRVAGRTAADATALTRCRIERDGDLVPSHLWVKGFQDVLDLQLAQGLDRLFEAWSASTTESAMTATAGLLCGRAALTWGWREGPGGLANQPLMRVLGDLDLGTELDVCMTGEVLLGVTRTRVRLLVQGKASGAGPIVREGVEPGLFPVLLSSVVRWRFEFRLEFDPMAVEEGALWSMVSPCTGAMVGEAGLRPRTSGGSGWQWYAQLDSEAVAVPVCIHDPLLGQTRQTLPLLPAVKLLDWSLG